MTKQRVMLPLSCERHLHEGYGISKDHPCPWCKVERLQRENAALRDAMELDHLDDRKRAIQRADEPSGSLQARFKCEGESCDRSFVIKYEPGAKILGASCVCGHYTPFKVPSLNRDEP